MLGTTEQLIARDRELEAVFAAIDGGGSGARAVVLEGEAGVGKTALWRCALGAAVERGWRPLTGSPARAEARLAFATLGDLLDREIDAVLPELPGPQRFALEVALLRRESDSAMREIDERMIGVATLAALRALAARGPLVVAIDDLQWLDASSAVALRFALRRLQDEQVLVIATRRIEPRSAAPLELERMLGDDRVQRLRIGPLTLGGVHELLVARLGLHASRSTLVRLHEVAGGNPFYCLEIGRELLALGREPTPNEPLPVPGSVRGLVRARMDRLAPRTRVVLLAAAALARPTRAMLARLGEPIEASLDEAIAAGIVELAADERVRFAHPLFASVHYEEAPLLERREMHARLADVVDDLEERARHLAMASSGADERVAAQLDLAAQRASTRGAPQAAAELCDLAARLTPGGADRGARVLAAAEYHHRAGSLGLATDRARQALEEADEPAVRARALGVLGAVAGDTEGVEAAATLYRRGVREPGAPGWLRANLHQKLAWLRLLHADARQAERHARAMLRLTAGGDQLARSTAAASLSLVIAARGRPVAPALLEQVRSGARSGCEERPWAWSETSPSVLEGVILLWAGELEQAHGPLEAMHCQASEVDDPWREMHALAYLAALETNLGRPQRGWKLAHRYLELALAADQDAQRAGALWPVAAAASWLGRTDEALQAAREGLALSERTGHHLYAIGNLSAMGAAALSLEDHATAGESLLRAWGLMRAGAVESVARFPVLSDLVEALLAGGEHDRAAALALEHARFARRLGRPWSLALAARCRGLIADGRGDERAAVAAFERALREHDRQDRPLDRARTLLAYGALHRRARRKVAARECLEPARDIFAAAGAEVWTRRAQAELGRIGGRRAPASGMLSATEAAIAEHVAAGRTNREVAGALHLSARTVEWNLSKLYRKLGVRSRTELARALATNGTGNGNGAAANPGIPRDLARHGGVKSGGSSG